MCREGASISQKGFLVPQMGREVWAFAPLKLWPCQTGLSAFLMPTLSPAKPSSTLPTLPRACGPSSTFQFRWHLRIKVQLLRGSIHTPMGARDWGVSCGSPAPTTLT